MNLKIAPCRKARFSRRGFTLAELLIALSILGVIAVFAIPKVLQAQQDSKYNAIAKEGIAAISDAFNAYKLKNAVTQDTKPTDLLPYFNYVNIDTTSLIDSDQTGTTWNCTDVSWEPCIRLHNGALLYFRGFKFAGTAKTNAISFFLDPDGKVLDGTVGGRGKSVEIWLYFNGRITTYGGLEPHTVSEDYNDYWACPACDPPWFSWSN